MSDADQTAIIGFPRQGSNFALSLGSWVGNYPQSNMLNDEYARVARTTDLNPNHTIIRGVCSHLVPARLFGIAAHNMSLTATYRLRLWDSTNSPSILVFDSGIQRVWPAAYSYTGRDWSTNNFWTGQYTEEEIEGQIPFCPILLDQNYLFSEFLLELLDPDNTDGYVDIGLLEIGYGWQVSINPQTPDTTYGILSKTTSNEAPGGVKRYDIYPGSYVFAGTIPIMDREEVQNKAMELFRQYDVHTPFMWMPHPDEPLNWLRNSKMVNLAELGLFSYITKTYDSVPLKLEEYKG